MLDHMGAVIDHEKAHSCGGEGALANLATACNKCNAKKNNMSEDKFYKGAPRPTVKGKYGEPENWDGLSALFVILIDRNSDTAIASELGWLRYLRAPASPATPP